MLLPAQKIEDFKRYSFIKVAA